MIVVIADLNWLELILQIDLRGSFTVHNHLLRRCARRTPFGVEATGVKATNI